MENQDNNRLFDLIRRTGRHNYEEVKLLIENGVNVNSQNTFGRTPLHVAVESGNLNLVKLLIEKGANLDIQDRDGRTPLHMAAMSNSLDIVKLLIEKGADVNVKDRNGQIPLQIGLRSHQPDIRQYSESVRDSVRDQARVYATFNSLNRMPPFKQNPDNYIYTFRDLPRELVDKIAGLQPHEKQGRLRVDNLRLPPGPNGGNRFGKIKISLQILKKDLKFLTKK
jgi:hypothetical protein